MTRPVFVDGQPANLEAAALDALEWLRHLRGPMAAREQRGEDYDRLLRCIAALEDHLPDDEPEMRAALPPTPFSVVRILYAELRDVAPRKGGVD